MTARRSGGTKKLRGGVWRRRGVRRTHEEEATTSNMPLVEVSGVCLILLQFCGHKTRETLLELRETRQLVSKVWAVDSKLPLTAFGITVRSSVPVTRCLSAEVRGVVTAATCEQFIVCVSQCVALFFAKTKRGDHWVVAVHCDDRDVTAVGWKQTEALSVPRSIRHPITEAPTVAVSMLWEANVRGTVKSMATNHSDSIAVGTEECMTLLNAHTGAVVTDKLEGEYVAFLDRKRVVGVAIAGYIRRWMLYEYTDNLLTTAVEIKAGIASMKASANGKQLYVSLLEHKELREYSTVNWQVTARMPFKAFFEGEFNISSNGLLAQSTVDFNSRGFCQCIKLLETKSCCMTQSIEMKHSHNGQLVFSPNSRHIVAGSSDGPLFLLDAISGQLIGEPRVAHCQRVTSVCFLTDQWFVSVSLDKSLVICHCDSQSPVRRIEGAHDEGIRFVVGLSTDSFATGDERGTVKKWKLVCK